jgi:amidase
MDDLKSRRGFLKAAAGVGASAPFLSHLTRAEAAAARDFDPSFGSASEAVHAIRAGVISSRELVAHTFKRIRQFNPKINAFVTLLEEPAMQRAAQADEALAAGKPWGPLHGLPILIKDVFETAGVRTTSGSKMLENYVPKNDAPAVARLKGAGAIVVGKTNLPEFAGDVQSYNEVAGTTNNPWDLTRTPGGSTGGGAAGLAAGFGFLELGSDIGGSIRTPCHFCGVYGLKPTLNVVPVEGHIPPPPGVVIAVVDLGVAGPLARSAQDLRLELEVIAGPTAPEAKAYTYRLLPPRGARLKDYRLGYVLDDPFCPVAPEVKEVLTGAVDALRKHGVEPEEGWPTGVDPQAAFDNYMRLLAGFFAPFIPPEELKLMHELVESPWGYYARREIEGAEGLHKDWLEQSGLRLKARQAWQDYFQTHDAFLMPEAFVPAIPHDHTPTHTVTFDQRTIATSQGPRPYGDILRWISFATLTGNPAAVAPVGRTRGGLPVGIQIMGPYLEDATPIDVAGLMADVVGGFQAPPGFAA